MTATLRDRVVAMVAECGLHEGPCSEYEVERFALAVAALVAEECAKECESERVDAVASGADDDRVYNAACDHCAAAIRRSAEGLR